MDPGKSGESRKKSESLLDPRSDSDFLPVAGLEPARCCHQQILSLPRLPIPTHRPSCTGSAICPSVQRKRFYHKSPWLSKQGRRIFTQFLLYFTKSGKPGLIQPGRKGEKTFGHLCDLQKIILRLSFHIQDHDRIVKGSAQQHPSSF